jgi:hypothetical protein
MGSWVNGCWQRLKPQSLIPARFFGYINIKLGIKLVIKAFIRLAG